MRVFFQAKGEVKTDAEGRIAFRYILLTLQCTLRLGLCGLCGQPGSEADAAACASLGQPFKPDWAEAAGQVLGDAAQKWLQLKVLGVLGAGMLDGQLAVLNQVRWGAAGAALQHTAAAPCSNPLAQARKQAGCNLNDGAAGHRRPLPAACILAAGRFWGCFCSLGLC
jgi:hypothetical protein